MSSMNDPEFRHEYVNSFHDSRLAAQIAAFRKAAGMTQVQLAERLGTAQSRVSAIESGDYSSWSLSTLRKLAGVFDVALSVEFVSFNSAIGRIEKSGPQDFRIQPGYPEVSRSVRDSARTSRNARGRAGRPKSRVSAVPAGPK